MTLAIDDINYSICDLYNDLISLLISPIPVQTLKALTFRMKNEEYYQTEILLPCVANVRDKLLLL